MQHGLLFVHAIIVASEDPKSVNKALLANGNVILMIP
jgi:hypothetical protein